MPEVLAIQTPIALSLAGTVRNRESTPDELRKALSSLGYEFSREIISRKATTTEVLTPIGEYASAVEFPMELTAVVTTKGDFDTFGRAIAQSLEPSIVGYMNFEGRRAHDALNTPVREIALPATDNRPVDTLVVAKSVLATGCTAISLTDTAVDLYRPRELVIASIFYSRSGISELLARFPAASIIVLGTPDELDENGLLHPGVGLIEERI